MVFLHGYGQSRMGWMTTPDGRPGWSDIFLRKGYGGYLVDQPRRGEAGQTSKAAEISTLTQDQNWYTQFRIGLWPKTYEGSQFPDDPESLNQFSGRCSRLRAAFLPTQEILTLMLLSQRS